MIFLFTIVFSLSYLPHLLVEAQFVNNVVHDHADHHQSISKWNTLNAALLVFLLIAIYWVAWKYFDGCQRRSSGHDTAHQAQRGVDPSILEVFPVFAYSEVSGLGLEKVPLECAVCLGSFEKHDKLRILPKCEHVFHLECVNRWLAGHTTCPLCRAELALQPDATKSQMELDCVGSGSRGVVGETINDIV